MREQRVIKKYPNRRLYDTTVSRYVTLNDVLELLRERETFIVQEQRSGRIITREILLQALQELERGEVALLSDDCLLALLRAHAAEPYERDRLRTALESTLNA